ncbi:hypothetical protein [Lentzea albidocapillata]|uniref:hypothetical protein n=1 Tax=Lentzea albidocapillata TaxID=40571 RepID=UPI0015A244B0|nr:hypothetical protein [Lentzea albidocapillata]
MTTEGVRLFLVGEAADMTWHVIFGIEVDLEAAQPSKPAVDVQRRPIGARRSPP